MKTLVYIKLYILNEWFSVLVNSGASNSYVPAAIVKVLNVPICDCKSSSVKLPNGTELAAKQYVRLRVGYKGRTPTEFVKFYVLPI